jgi:hypothetical protein
VRPFRTSVLNIADLAHISFTCMGFIRTFYVHVPVYRLAFSPSVYTEEGGNRDDAFSQSTWEEGMNVLEWTLAKNMGVVWRTNE